MLGVEGRKQHERIISKCSGEYRETAKDARDNLGKRQQRCSCSKHALFVCAPQMKLVVTSCSASDFAARFLPLLPLTVCCVFCHQRSIRICTKRGGRGGGNDARRREEETLK